MSEANNTKAWLYHRPKHAAVTLVDKLPNGNNVARGVQAVSAFTGIMEAVKATSMGNGQLIDSLRIIKKLDSANQYPDANLIEEYVVFTEAEKALIIAAVTGFNWSKFVAESGNTVWTSWVEFLAGFNAEFEEEYARSWIAYDPLNPPVEFAEWKKKHAASKAEYEAKVAEAEARALASKEVKTESPVVAKPAASEDAAPANDAVVVESSSAQQDGSEPVV